MPTPPADAKPAPKESPQLHRCGQPSARHLAHASRTQTLSWCRGSHDVRPAALCVTSCLGKLLLAMLYFFIHVIIRNAPSCSLMSKDDVHLPYLRWL